MQRKASLQLRRRSSLFVFIALLPAVLIQVDPIASSARQQERPRSEFGIEISVPDPMRPIVRLAGPRGGGGQTLIRRNSLTINDPTAAADFTAIHVRAEVEGDAMRVTLSLIYNDLSVQDLWNDRKEKLAGSYLIREGESTRPNELAAYGIEPFEMKVIGSRTVAFKPGEGPRIINNTTALEVERLEKHLDSYSVWLKNRSSKDIVVYSVQSGNSGATSGVGMIGPAIAAGATSHETHMSSSEVESNGVTIALAIFSDGTFEGDAKSATKFLATREGVKAQAPHVLRMIEQTIKIEDSDLRSAFRKLEADLWVIPEAVYKPAALEFLKTRFPSQDERGLNALYEDFKGGLYDARNIALSSLGDTLRLVQDLEQRGQYASAVESIRRTLEGLRETLGTIVSSPH